MALTDYADEDLLLDAEWPTEVDFIICTLETTPFWGAPQFLQRSVPYRVSTVFESSGHDDVHILYIRGVSARGLSFIAPKQLPPSCRGVLRLVSPAGIHKKIDCVSLQCRPAALGWVEGTISFNRPEPDLVPATPESIRDEHTSMARQNWNHQ